MIRSIIFKSFNIVMKYFLYKALPPGTRRKRKDGIYEKQPTGKWLKVTEKNPEKKKEEKNNLQQESEKYINIKIKKYKDIEESSKKEVKDFEKNMFKKYGEYFRAEMNNQEEKKLKELKKKEYDAINDTNNQYKKYREEFVKTQLKYKTIEEFPEKSNTNKNEWYHGTFGIFNKFDKGEQGKNWAGEASKLGINLTDTKNEALEYGDIVKKIKVNLGNNKKIDKETMQENYEEYIRMKMEQKYEDEFEAEEQANEIINNTEFIDIINYYAKKAKKEGYDSVTMTNLDIWEDIEGDTTNTIIFDNENVEIMDNAI